MRAADHSRRDRIIIAQVNGTAHHRDAQHRELWPDVVARLRAITTDGHLLAHAVYRDDPAEVDELLRMAGADMDEVARLRAAPLSPGLGGMAERINARHAAGTGHSADRI